MYDITIIGAAIIDILASPICKENLSVRSYPTECISMAIGGDGANEATTLSRLGKRVNLITKLGNDLTGKMLQNHFRENHISLEDAVIEEGLDTGINIVLVDKDAERSFITNKNGSLRRLSLPDISLDALSKSSIVCFASIFVSPLFDTPAMATLFKAAKDRGCMLCADTTRCKNGETLSDIRDAIQYLDYIFPNYEEAKAVAGKEKPEDIADAFLDCGVSCIVLKLGSKGCLIKTKERCLKIPAYPNTKCIDTTGAGDNFAAGFLYALSEKMSLEDCGRFANMTASIAVESVGACTGVRNLEQVMERFRAS